MNHNHAMRSKSRDTFEFGMMSDVHQGSTSISYITAWKSNLFFLYIYGIYNVIPLLDINISVSRCGVVPLHGARFMNMFIIQINKLVRKKKFS